MGTRGRGKATWPDGIYEGDFEGGKNEGCGKLTKRGGAISEGGFKNEARKGHGKFITPDVSTYEEDLKGGKMNFGKLTRPDGSIYEGALKGGRREGCGKLTTPEGSIYIGYLKGVSREGYVKFT